MLMASALYALHLPINQRVLYDIPAPTVTLYTLLAMSIIVVPAYLFSGALPQITSLGHSWWPILALTLVTFFSPAACGFTLTLLLIIRPLTIYSERRHGWPPPYDAYLHVF